MYVFFKGTEKWSEIYIIMSQMHFCKKWGTVLEYYFGKNENQLYEKYFSESIWY